MVYRIYVEKKSGLDNEARALLSEIKTFDDFYRLYLAEIDWNIAASIFLPNGRSPYGPTG